MKTIKILAVILFAVAMFFGIDYGLGHREPMEIGIVVDKNFAPPTYNTVKHPPLNYVLTVTQPGDQNGYFFSVPKDYFYSVHTCQHLDNPCEPSRVPLSKHYGLITGWEYSQELSIGDYLPPIKRNKES